MGGIGRNRQERELRLAGRLALAALEFRCGHLALGTTALRMQLVQLWIEEPVVLGAVLDLLVCCIFASFLLPLPWPFLDLHVWHHRNLKALGRACTTCPAGCSASFPGLSASLRGEGSCKDKQRCFVCSLLHAARCTFPERSPAARGPDVPWVPWSSAKV